MSPAAITDQGDFFQESSHTEEQAAAEGDEDEEEEDEIKPSTSHGFTGNNCEEIDDNEGRN